jgi:hypothetical protein
MIYSTVSLTANGPRRDRGERSDALAVFLCQAMEAKECGGLADLGEGASAPDADVFGSAGSENVAGRHRTLGAPRYFGAPPSVVHRRWPA